MTNKSTIKLRIEQLTAMDDFMNSINDEDLIESWLSDGVPDEANEDDYEFIASDDELYNDCVRLFKKTTQNEDCYY